MTAFKNLKKRKILSLIMASAMCYTIIQPGMCFASNLDSNTNTTNSGTTELQMSTNDLEQTPLLDSLDKEKLSAWVDYDNNNLTFSIKDGASQALTNSEYKTLNECIKITNYNIANADLSSGEISIVSPTDKVSEKNTEFYAKSYRSARAKSYKNGVNKITFHWWGATVYISKSTITKIGNGCTIGGIWIPQVLLARVVATAGVGLMSCPGGICFDYNFVKAGINALLPGSIINKFNGVQNVRFQ